MKAKQQIEYHGGRIKSLVETVARMVAKDPYLAENTDMLHTFLKTQLEGYGHRDKCFNCHRSMKVSVYTADLLDALLILGMARQVRENMKTMPFTEANKVHIPTLELTQGTLKRFTKCDYLGLIKQHENWRGSGYWCLTSWAWKALRGYEIPKSVKYWEGNLIGRSEETTTLAGMFRTHSDIIHKAIEKRKAIKVDHRAKYEEYSPSEWSDFGGYVEPEETV